MGYKRARRDLIELMPGQRVKGDDFHKAINNVVRLH